MFTTVTDAIANWFSRLLVNIFDFFSPSVHIPRLQVAEEHPGSSKIHEEDADGDVSTLRVDASEVF